MRKPTIVALTLIGLVAMPAFAAKEETVADKIKNAHNLVKKRQYAAAVELLTPILAADPNNVHAALERAAANLALGNTKEAIADLDNAIKLAPNEQQAYVMRSRAHAAEDR